MNLPDLLDRARRLRGRDWLDLLRAHAALVAAARDVRLEKRGLLRRTAKREGEPERSEPGDASGVDRRTRRARELALAVERAVEYGPLRFRCLVRALAVRRLLEREGLEGGIVRVGVRHRDGEFAAHAWVEFEGVPLRQSPHRLEIFTPLSELDVFPEG